MGNSTRNRRRNLALSPDRPGILLGKIHQHELRIAHEFAIAFGAQFSGKQLYSCSQEEAIVFGRQKIFPAQIIFQKSRYSFSLKAFPWVLRRMENLLKNNLPRNFLAH